MAVTMNTGIAIGTIPLAWINKINDASGGEIVGLWKLDNVQSCEYIIKSPSTTTEGGGDKIEVTRGDGATIQFSKNAIKIKGDDETDATPAAQSTDATNKGEIKIKVNEMSVGASNWTSFIEQIKANMDGLFLVTVPSGVSYKGLTDVTKRRPDGYVHLICKLSGDINIALSGNSITTIDLNFISYKNTVTGITTTKIGALYDGTTKHPNIWKINATTTKTLYPPAITTTGTPSLAQRLLDGDIVIVPTETW